MHDIMKETPIYQEILREGQEEGREKGRKEGQVEALQQMAVALVERHFPSCVSLAKQQVDSVHDVDRLQLLIIQLSVVQSLEEVRQELLALTQNEH